MKIGRRKRCWRRTSTGEPAGRPPGNSTRPGGLGSTTAARRRRWPASAARWTPPTRRERRPGFLLRPGQESRECARRGCAPGTLRYFPAVRGTGSTGVSGSCGPRSAALPSWPGPLSAQAQLRKPDHARARAPITLHALTRHGAGLRPPYRPRLTGKLPGETGALSCRADLPRPGPGHGYGARPRRGRAGRADRQRAYRQPSAGATWVRMLSMTWAL
jgi:hypothetical protein